MNATTVTHIATAAHEALSFTHDAADVIAEGTAICSTEQLAGYYAFSADLKGNEAGLPGVTLVGMRAHLGFISEAEFDEEEAMEWAQKFWAAKVAERLEAAIAAFEGETGPGVWSASDDGGKTSNTVSGATLVYAWPEEDYPEGLEGDEPWRVWGGSAIAASAGFLISEGSNDNDEHGTIYCSAAIEGTRLVVTALANGSVIQTEDEIEGVEHSTPEECEKAGRCASDERIALALAVIANNR